MCFTHKKIRDKRKIKKSVKVHPEKQSTIKSSSQNISKFNIKSDK